MSYVIYGLKEPRITLYEDDGITPRYRVTLQKETREGLELTFKPEGVTHQLGSGASWARRWIHRGHRITLDLKWSHGLNAAVETWSGSAWGASTTITLAQALSVIATWANHNPCLVSPHKDLAFEFLAQPGGGKGLTFRDLKGFAHTGLELSLISTVLVKDLPDWTNLNDYFTSGYTDDGYVGSFTP